MLTDQLVTSQSQYCRSPLVTNLSAILGVNSDPSLFLNIAIHGSPVWQHSDCEVISTLIQYVL